MFRHRPFRSIFCGQGSCRDKSILSTTDKHSFTQIFPISDLCPSVSICVHLWFNLKDDIPINQIIAGIEIEIGIAPPIGNKNPQANALNPTIAVSRRCPSHMGDIS
ncbi:MAG: hypothetical protein PHG55_07825 [Verrucomicrobiota bacterium]|nr:hypothetical protein [Verrucomicrobiota bacterium]